jgi:oligopeptide/dipeptide ABC transporter ATP-binding protein
MTDPILEIKCLRTQFQTRGGIVKAVDGVDLSLDRGQTLGIVGESGCGKSVTALSILRLLPKPAGRIAAGQILFAGRDLVKVSSAEIRRIRGNDISMIFQEPMTSLNPVYTVGFQIQEVLRKHRHMKQRQALEEAVRVLGLVGIPEPAARVDDYPHQMSGGMRQRVMIAVALSCHPQVMIADEPTTALDVTIQAQILDLIDRLKQEIGMSVLLITHDLGVVAEICRQVVVMYAGKLVECAEVRELFAHPAHPYTVGLFGSLPNVAGRGGTLHPIAGVVPSLLDLPPGCAFEERCSRSRPECRPVG